MISDTLKKLLRQPQKRGCHTVFPGKGSGDRAWRGETKSEHHLLEGTAMV